MIFAVLGGVLLAILFAVSLAGADTDVSATTIVWGIVAMMFIWGLVSRQWRSDGLPRDEALKALAIAIAFTGIGVAVRALWTEATVLDLALMRIHEHEYFGARIQAVGYALLSVLLGITSRRLIRDARQ